MKVQIESIFPPGELPRYVFGRKDSDEYVVFAPMDNDADFGFELNDTVKFSKVIQGPAEALNLTKNTTTPVRIYDICINKDVIRVRYDSTFP